MKAKRKIAPPKGISGAGKDISELYGSGKGLWQGQDAQEYVASGRKERMPRVSAMEKRTDSGKAC